MTLWFLDRGKRGTPREDTVLFLDARHTYRQIDRAHRDFLPEQIELLANTVRLYRGEDPESVAGSEAAHGRALPGRRRTPTCRASARSPRSRRSRRRAGASTRAATSGVAAGEEDDGDFAERLAELHDEFTALSDEAELLRRQVDAAVRGILEA